ncbi:hypothetical protein [Paraflavitalea speifideaquila]|uniref:hypothetical protein n=1 Tax=Paraflavitalea speifideaquila TaxID=3076558 RepID=UPI0028EFFF2B|nr:hypothetical protein [Paraflavitalea speifideiaquila]
MDEFKNTSLITAMSWILKSLHARKSGSIFSAKRKWLKTRCFFNGQMDSCRRYPGCHIHIDLPVTTLGKTRNGSQTTRQHQ